jgi:hypothetical protein
MLGHPRGRLRHEAAILAAEDDERRGHEEAFFDSLSNIRSEASERLSTTPSIKGIYNRTCTNEIAIGGVRRAWHGIPPLRRRERGRSL